jgi:5'-deoxynucleotidase YfbR-like HD superfamily hydrolase
VSGHVPSRYEIETASGRYVDLFAPKHKTIRLHDIAHGLAHTCRFGGQTRTFYSVAEHACIVARKVAEHAPHLALAALHHDDHEAYTGDVPRPLKLLLDKLTADETGDSQWRYVEDDLNHAIWRALTWDDVGWVTRDFDNALVKAADNWALASEAAALMPSRGATWGVPAEWPVDTSIVRALDPGDAYHEWLGLHAALCRGEVVA